MVGYPGGAQTIEERRLHLGELPSPLALAGVQALELHLRGGPRQALVRHLEQLRGILGTEISEMVAVLGPRAAQTALEHLPTVHLLLHRAARDETIHDDVAGLSDAIGAIHGLRVRRRVPRRVVDHHAIGRGEGQTQPANLRGEQRERNVGIALEPFHPRVSLSSGGTCPSIRTSSCPSARAARSSTSSMHLD